MTGSRNGSWSAAIRIAVAAAAGAALLSLAPAAAAEFQANTYTTSHQTTTAVAMNADGAFVVAWNSEAQDGDLGGIFARRFASTGSALGAEFQVNTTTAGQQGSLAVAIDDGGDFVIAWGSNPFDGGIYGVAARRFDSSGVAQATEFQVNTYTTGMQRIPAAAMDADGDFVVVWNSAGQDGYFAGVFGQRFDAAGAKLGTEFQVATYTNGQEQLASVAMSNSGAFVVTWSSGHDGDYNGVFARAFNSTGAAVGPGFQVNTYTTGQQYFPSVGIDAFLGFVITWESYGQDGDLGGVFGQRFNVLLAPVGGEFQVSVRTSGIQARPRIARADGGAFVVAWESEGQDGDSRGIFSRAFLTSGAAAGELQVNSFTPQAQYNPAIGIDGGRFVVAWTSSNQDGSGYGVFANRLTVPATLDVDANGEVAPLTDGLLVLRFLFGFTGPTLVNGAVGQGCTRCDAPSIQGYLQALV